MRTCVQMCVAATAFGLLLTGSDALQAGGAPSIGNRFVVVTYWGEDHVAMIDLDGVPGSETVFDIDVLKTKNCSKPYDVKINRTGTKAYVTCSGTDKIIIIDLIAQLPDPNDITSGSGPRDIALSRDEKIAVVANSGEDTISVINIPERRVLYKVPVEQPYGVALNGDETLAAVTTWASGDLHLITLGQTSGTVQRKIAVGPLAYTVVIPPGEDIAYVTVNARHVVIAVDTKTGAILGPIAVGHNPWGAGPSTDGKVLLVANNRSADVTILKNNSGKGTLMVAETTITTGAGGKGPGAVMSAPKNVSVSANGQRGVVTDLANNEVMVLNLQNGTKIKTINVGKAPYGIEFAR
jgi:YVTN family beta-propeller protein